MFTSLIFSTLTLNMKPSIIRRSRPIVMNTDWSYTMLIDALHHDQIKEARILPSAIIQSLTNDGIHSSQLLPTQVASVAEKFVNNGIDIAFVSPSAVSGLVNSVLSFLPLVIGFFIISSVLGRSQQFGVMNAMQQNNAPSIVENVNTTFADVAGCDGAKEELMEIVNFLNDPSVFIRAGARVPKGVLLEGPPGTGKTLLARAVAGEANVNFIPTTASSFVEMYVGLGAARVRSLFAGAKNNAPCIIWIDEIDAVARTRNSGPQSSGGNEERETTLNELLSAMDGFESDTGIVVLAATNRADVLDDALIRPGRFDRRILVDLPNKKGRTDILKVHSKNKIIEDDVLLEDIADQTSGFSGAKLESLMNEAAIRAARQNRTIIKTADIQGAIDRVLMGLEKPISESPKTLERVAIHEIGHAIVGHFIEESEDRIRKITIIPRSSGAGGFTSFSQSEDTNVDGLYTREYLFAQIVILMGGRAAEELVLGKNTISTGASNDLMRAESLARDMISKWGFGNTLIAYDYSKQMSIKTSESIDEQIEDLIDDAYSRATSILNSNKMLLLNVSKKLVKEKTIDAKMFYELVD